MEAAVLDGMGISYETEQPIELTIRKENPDDRNEFEEQLRKFVFSSLESVAVQIIVTENIRINFIDCSDQKQFILMNFLKKRTTKCDA